MAQNWHGEVVSISDLLDRARLALDQHVGRIAVEAEVFEYRGPHSSGHFYFKLRDQESSIDVKMWRGMAARGMRCNLQEGRSVLAIGRLDIWAKRGSLSFLLDEVHDLGAGDLSRRFEELKTRLRLEGLFDEARRQAIPERPRKVCLISAQPSAAAADILRTFVDAKPPFEVNFLASKVQGEGAAQELVRRLELAVQNHADVILLARGGGSLEDLWAFNEEILVRAVAACPVPVICAVGHESDFTLCDFVADERAKTPTAGAARLCSGWQQAAAEVEQLWQRLAVAGQLWLRDASQNLNTCRLQLHAQSPEKRLERFRRHVHENELRIAHAMDSILRTARRSFAVQVEGLRRHGPATPLAQMQQRLQGFAARLNAGSPEALLLRGYALVEAETGGEFIRDAEQIEVGQKIRISLARGGLEADVTARTKPSNLRQ
ncbi:MAG: exodeoxyribonuclease VII large subunit [Planctomycetes bacterium]|nr:exodeoxyribonuclease VII large subunit [Planctomycetota bacterium]